MHGGSEVGKSGVQCAMEPWFCCLGGRPRLALVDSALRRVDNDLHGCLGGAEVVEPWLSRNSILMWRLDLATARVGLIAGRGE